MRTKSFMFLTVFCLLLASCNLPNARATPVVPISKALEVNVVGTAVELTTIARLTELADTATATATVTPASAPTENAASPTPCTALVTATVDANIRSGPGTVYSVVGALPLGRTAKVAGHNDANSWWYIEFAGGLGGHAWIAGSVVTASCLPPVVQVVAAPPTPLPTATEEITPTPPEGTPDLVAFAWQWTPIPGKKDQPLSIMVSVTNDGTAPAGQFTVVWLSNQDRPGCSWTVSGLAVGERKNLECTFTYTTAQYPAASNTFWISFIVDPDNDVVELSDSNNQKQAQWKVDR